MNTGFTLGPLSGQTWGRWTTWSLRRFCKGTGWEAWKRGSPSWLWLCGSWRAAGPEASCWHLPCCGMSRNEWEDSRSTTMSSASWGVGLILRAGREETAKHMTGRMAVRKEATAVTGLKTCRWAWPFPSGTKVTVLASELSPWEIFSGEEPGEIPRGGLREAGLGVLRNKARPSPCEGELWGVGRREPPQARLAFLWPSCPWGGLEQYVSSCKELFRQCSWGFTPFVRSQVHLALCWAEGRTCKQLLSERISREGL